MLFYRLYVHYTIVRMYNVLLHMLTDYVHLLGCASLRRASPAGNGARLVT